MIAIFEGINTETNSIELWVVIFEVIKAYSKWNVNDAYNFSTAGKKKRTRRRFRVKMIEPWH